MANNSVWKVGAATADITPPGPIVLTGYIRSAPSEGVRNPITVKVLYLEGADQSRALIINADLCGFSAAVVDQVKTEANRRFGIAPEFIILSATHTHSAPALNGVLDFYHDLSAADRETVTRYSAELPGKILAGIALAFERASPCTLQAGRGAVGFGVNRRRLRPAGRDYPTIVDQDVPVLFARGTDGAVSAILFSYACHTTVMFDNWIDGDYSGYAQRELEAQFPGSTAIYLAGCGGDINPIPRRRVALSETYGKLLATAVLDVIESAPTALTESTISAVAADVNLALETAPTAARLGAALEPATLRKRILDDQFTPMPVGMTPAEIEALFDETIRYEKRKLGNLLQLHAQPSGPPRELPFPIQALRLGNQLLLVALSGEPVVEYALRLKARYGVDTTWPLGYCNGYLPYIPSLRVLREGGYEGRTCMAEFGLSPFTETVEETVHAKVGELVASLP